MSNATDKHTPGPWRIVPGGGHAYNSIAGAESIQVGGWPESRGGISNASYSDRVCENLGNLDLPGPAANAALILSAPALLALARQYASECGECSGSGVSQDTHRDCESCADIRAAIARATNSEDAK